MQKFVILLNAFLMRCSQIICTRDEACDVVCINTSDKRPSIVFFMCISSKSEFTIKRSNFYIEIAQHLKIPEVNFP